MEGSSQMLDLWPNICTTFESPIVSRSSKGIHKHMQRKCTCSFRQNLLVIHRASNDTLFVINLLIRKYKMLLLLLFVFIFSLQTILLNWRNFKQYSIMAISNSSYRLSKVNSAIQSELSPPPVFQSKFIRKFISSSPFIGIPKNQKNALVWCIHSIVVANFGIVWRAQMI